MKNTDSEAISALNNNLQEQGFDMQGRDVSNLPENGLMRTQTQYSTAIQVIRPRNLNLVENRCLQEAARAGGEFYYSWSQGGSIIEGLTVGAALMIARNWGNCAVDCPVNEMPNSYVFYGAFIDLETGFNLIRPFKMTKQSPKNKQGRDIYSGERGKDIIFQIGTSKAIRNVVLNAVPKWLTEKVIETAKRNVVAQIEKMGKEKAIQKLILKAEALKISWDRVEANYGRKESWDIDKIVAVMGAIRSVEDGVESMDEVFADKVAVNGEPEFANKKKESGKPPETDKNSEPESANEAGEDQVSPPAGIDWENPQSVLAAYQALSTTKELSEFRRENLQRLEMLEGDKDFMKGISEHEDSVLSKGKKK